MFSTNDFLSKPIITLAEGRNLGTVTNFVFEANLKKVSALIAYDETSRCHFSVQLKSVINTLFDAVIISSAESLTKVESDFHFNPINCSVFTTSGIFWGFVTEVFFEKNSVSHLVARNERIEVAQIHAISEKTILVRDCRVPKKKPAPKENGSKPKHPVSKTLSAFNAKAPTPPPISTTQIKTLSGSFLFLLGRKCDKTIVDRQNIVLLKKGALVTIDTIKIARANGKLIELSLHCKPSGSKHAQ